jgi:Ca-activated chloride channel family protein
MSNRNVLRITCCVLLWLTAVGSLTACVPEVVQHNETGNEHFEEQAYESAIDEYKLAQVTEPDLAEPYYNAANAYNRMSQVEEAQLQTQQALKTADPTLAAQAWYNLGNAYFDAEQWRPAIEAYQEALRLQPDDQDAKHNLELALQKLAMQQQQQEQQEQQDSEKEEGEQQEEASQDEQQEKQEGEQQEPSPEQQGGEATPTPSSEDAESQIGQDEQQEGEQTPQPSGQEEEQQLTEEQAVQLLRALLSGSQTLQEYLREIYQVPGPAPEQDW